MTVKFDIHDHQRVLCVYMVPHRSRTSAGEQKTMRNQSSLTCQSPKIKPNTTPLFLYILCCWREKKLLMLATHFLFFPSFSGTRAVFLCKSFKILICSLHSPSSCVSRGGTLMILSLRGNRRLAEAARGSFRSIH